MRIDPAIHALRADRALQQQAQRAMFAACDAWRQDPAVSGALDELERFGDGAPLEACPALEGLFTGQDEAPALAAALSRHFAAALAAVPFGHPPFRHSYDGAVSTLLLASAGRAHLTLHAREPGTCDHDISGYSDALRYDAVLAGEADARIVRCTQRRGQDLPVLHSEAITLCAGSRIALDLDTETLQVLAARGRLVTLRLHRSAADPRPAREHALEDGRLLRQASGSIRSSRQEMMLALLGRMSRPEAVPTMAAMALDEGDDSLRWQSLRECLALDTATGFATLATLARRAGDPLAAAAGALRAQLVEAHPQLLALESPQCPA